LNIDDPGRRARFAARGFARLEQQCKIDLFKTSRLRQAVRRQQRPGQNVSGWQWLTRDPSGRIKVLRDQAGGGFLLVDSGDTIKDVAASVKVNRATNYRALGIGAAAK